MHNIETICPEPHLEIGHFSRNPDGIPSQSPGLRFPRRSAAKAGGTSYPGLQNMRTTTPSGSRLSPTQIVHPRRLRQGWVDSQAVWKSLRDRRAANGESRRKGRRFLVEKTKWMYAAASDCGINYFSFWSQPRWGCQTRCHLSQGSSFLATLGF